MLLSKLVDLLTIGEAFEDLIFAGLPRLPRPGEELRVPSFTATVGGGALITSVTASRLGLRVGIVTAVGERGAAVLRVERVKLMNLQQPREASAVSVALSTLQDRSFVTYGGVNLVLESRILRQLRARPPKARHVHFALSPRDCRMWIPVVRKLRNAGATTSWDFGWNDRLLRDRALASLVGAVDWLFLNEQEDRLYRQARRHARRTVLKLGAGGSILYAEGATLRRRANRARVVDTTGAGDAFDGGFLAALLRRGDAAHALRLATYVGARATEGLGGIASLPSAKSLPRWARAILEAA